MMKYIDADKLIAEIERHRLSNRYIDTEGYENELLEIITSLQQEQPEVDLEEEAYMRGFAQGAKEERERILADIKEIHSKTASEFAVHLVCTDSEPDCTTAKCGIRYALDALFSWLKANGCDMSAYYPYK